jgi:hypothetical protein
MIALGNVSISDKVVHVQESQHAFKYCHFQPYFSSMLGNGGPISAFCFYLVIQGLLHPSWRGFVIEFYPPRRPCS